MRRRVAYDDARTPPLPDRRRLRCRFCFCRLLRCRRGRAHRACADAKSPSRLRRSTAFDNARPVAHAFRCARIPRRLGAHVRTSRRSAASPSLHMQPDGAHFVARHRQRLLAALPHRLRGRPARPALADAEMAPVLGADGKPLACARLVRHGVAGRGGRRSSMSASSASRRSSASILPRTA